MFAFALFGDNAPTVDPHTLGAGALAGTFILAVGMWIDKVLAYRKDQRDKDREAAKDRAKIEADALKESAATKAANDLALENAKIAAATATMKIKMDMYETQLKACHESHQEAVKQFAEGEKDRAIIHEKVATIEKQLDKKDLNPPPCT
jgi:hypothetical protein